MALTGERLGLVAALVAALGGAGCGQPQDSVSAPSFSPSSGTFADSVTVEISTDTEGATIRYTTDGTEPGGESTEYSGPLEITESTTLAAIAQREGWIDSAVRSAEYTITHTPSESVEVRIEWETVNGATARRRDLQKSAVDAMYEGYYAQLGNRIEFNGKTGLTPSEFILGLQWIVLMNEEHCYFLWTVPYEVPEDRFGCLHADFTSDVSSTEGAEVRRGEYTTLMAYFLTYNYTTGNSEWLDVPLEYRPRVEIQIPGYDSEVWPDVLQVFCSQEYWGENYDTVHYERRYVEDEAAFDFTMGFLQPLLHVEEGGAVQVVEPMPPEYPVAELGTYLTVDYKELIDGVDVWTWQNVLLPQIFVFGTTVEEECGMFPGYPGEEQWSDISIWAGESGGPVGGAVQASILGLPWSESFVVSENAQEVVIHFGIDLEEIVEVWDNGTPEDKSDDIAALAPRYWDRMTLEVEELGLIEEEGGSTEE